MGLCIGELNDDLRSDRKFTYTRTEIHTVAEKVDTVRIVHIHSVIVLRLSGKRKGRVEISPEQLSVALTEAERLAELTGGTLRVVGWFHCHPHVTIMEQGFVGLVFSCFLQDKNTKIEQYERIEIPIHIVPHGTIGKVCLESAIELPKILLPHLDSVAKIHNGSWLEDRLERNQKHLQELQQEKKEFMQEFSSLE
ncbi:hypothetical protein FD754_001446 [Muntiacus muntjak]|uniref:JAB1/MPN/MOV34 metalloenzyme domain-containing protein n=1 Tax=Muntiacus muntjak TaxID=9888 RepID=A0A5N3W6I3_MUNMU|nr:hypothetical protein FD754_001446 [Muntiacus muntjak]